MSGIIGTSSNRSGVIKSYGLEHIARYDWSSGNSMLASNCFSDKFDTYLVKIFARPSTDANAINMRLNNDGTDNEASSYWSTLSGRDWDNATYNGGSVAATYAPLSPNSSNHANYSVDATLWVYNARSTTKNIQMTGDITWLHGSGMGVGARLSIGHNANTIQWEGIRIYASSDLNSGNNITVWGLIT